MRAKNRNGNLKLYTIGFTRKSAEEFFSTLARAHVRRLIDVRLSNRSQLAGFSKRDDLAYFARTICRIDYRPMPELAPTRAMLDSYRKSKGSWQSYECEFLALMAERAIEKIDRRELDGGCLLCSEALPHRCHRRLVGEYLREKWGDVAIEHL